MVMVSVSGIIKAFYMHDILCPRSSQELGNTLTSET